MKEILYNMDEVQAAEIHDNGNICVTMREKDKDGNPRRWTSKEGQFCDIDALYDHLTVLRGHEVDDDE